MPEIDLSLPGHDAEDVEREQHAHGVELAVGAIQEVGDHDITLQFRILLESELGVGLVALSGEADVIELDLIYTRTGDIFRQSQVVILNLQVGDVSPHQFSVFAPRLVEAARLDCQSAVILGDVVIAEERLAGDGMHVERMNEADKLWQVADGIALQLACQRVIERNVDTAVAILDVEHYGVASGFTPATDDLNAFRATSGRAGQINGANLFILGERTALLDDRLRLHPRNQRLLILLETCLTAIRLADRLFELRYRHVRGVGEILARQEESGGCGFGGIDERTIRHRRRRLHRHGRALGGGNMSRTPRDQQRGKGKDKDRENNRGDDPRLLGKHDARFRGRAAS